MDLQVARLPCDRQATVSGRYAQSWRGTHLQVLCGMPLVAQRPPGSSGLYAARGVGRGEASALVQAPSFIRVLEVQRVLESTVV